MITLMKTMQATTKSPLETFPGELARSLPNAQPSLTGRTVQPERLIAYGSCSSSLPPIVALMALVRDEMNDFSSQTEAIRNIKYTNLTGKRTTPYNELQNLANLIAPQVALLTKVNPTEKSRGFFNASVARPGLHVLEFVKKGRKLTSIQRERLDDLREDLNSLSALFQSEHPEKMTLEGSPKTLLEKESSPEYWVKQGPELINQRLCRLIDELDSLRLNINLIDIRPMGLSHSVAERLIDDLKTELGAIKQLGAHTTVEDVIGFINAYKVIFGKRLALASKCPPDSYRLNDLDKIWIEYGNYFNALLESSSLWSFRYQLLNEAMDTVALAMRHALTDFSLEELSRPARIALLLKDLVPEAKQLQTKLALQVAKDPTLSPSFKEVIRELSTRITHAVKDWSHFVDSIDHSKLKSLLKLESNVDIGALSELYSKFRCVPRETAIHEKILHVGAELSKEDGKVHSSIFDTLIQLLLLVDIVDRSVEAHGKTITLTCVDSQPIQVDNLPSYSKEVESLFAPFEHFFASRDKDSSFKPLMQSIKTLLVNCLHSEKIVAYFGKERSQMTQDFFDKVWPGASLEELPTNKAPESSSSSNILPSNDPLKSSSESEGRPASNRFNQQFIVTHYDPELLTAIPEPVDAEPSLPPGDCFPPPKPIAIAYPPVKRHRKQEKKESKPANKSAPITKKTEPPKTHQASSPLPRISGNDRKPSHMRDLLINLGCRPLRKGGNHRIWTNGEGIAFPAPFNHQKTLGKGISKKLISQATGKR